MSLTNLYKAQNAGGSIWVDSIGGLNMTHYGSPTKTFAGNGYIRYDSPTVYAWGGGKTSKYIQPGVNGTWLLDTHANGPWAIFLKFKKLGGDNIFVVNNSSIGSTSLKIRYNLGYLVVSIDDGGGHIDSYSLPEIHATNWNTLWILFNPRVASIIANGKYRNNNYGAYNSTSFGGNTAGVCLASIYAQTTVGASYGSGTVDFGEVRKYYNELPSNAKAKNLEALSKGFI